ncbi:hypothetical protein SAMN04487939_10879 [Lysobacter sp. yr284]|uniref:hypothetical protein n=1 Tax=Lysobacter sp. yr284 TaxID=1761791 RepID=UPI00089C749D|nr:hypothetical protein [Lysobacter sp. yr284]SDY90425.1 hypothetical protein SAMN04487939_10879 [Lysobacter sp. yr284]
MHAPHDPSRRLLLRAPLLAAVAAALPAAAIAAAPAVSAAAGGADPARAFDFFLGHWQVRYRRLRERLMGSDDWEEFEGRCQTQSLFGGLAQFDESVVNRPGLPYRGLALRSFDPAARRWADWWLDTRNPQRIAAPMIGGFADGEGRFFGESELRGTTVKVRGLWTDIGAERVQWEQAYSADGGASWETNWVSRYRRVG